MASWRHPGSILETPGLDFGGPSIVLSTSWRPSWHQIGTQDPPKSENIIPKTMG